MSSDDDTDSMYNTEEEEEEDELPLLDAELDRREADPSSITEPAPSEVVQELRDYLLNGGDPLRVGGYLDVLHQLGHTPKSTDPLCAEEYNLLCMVEYGDDNPALNDWSYWAQLSQDHEAEVRLLRYGEFLDLLDEKGLGPPSDWQFKELDCEVDYPEDTTIPEEWEDNLTEAQLKAYSKNILGQFILYVNKNTTKDLANQNGALMLLDITETSLLEQCRKTQALYDEESVLGGLKGQKHKKHMHQSYGKMTQAILSHFSGTGAVGRLVRNWAQMMVAAADNDLAIAAAILNNPKRLIQIRQQALDAALALEQDEERPEWALHAWWSAFEALTSLMIRAVTAFRLHRGAKWMEFTQESLIDESTQQGKAALKYYWDHLEPLIWKSLQSSNITERACTMDSVPGLLKLLGVDACIDFIMPEKWEIIRGLSVDQEPPAGLNGRQQRRFDVAAPNLVLDTTDLLVVLVQRGMSTNRGGQVVPGSLVRKLISRGLVEVFTEVAESIHPAAAVAAVNGLAQLSRVKDCRLILLQSKIGVRLIKTTLKSSNLCKISPLLLLIVHLLWDNEWAEPLTKMQDPPLEQIVVQCAATAMKMIRKTAYSMRDRIQAEGQEDLAKEYVDTLKEYGLVEAKKVLKKMGDSAKAWKRLEAREKWLDESQCLLARAMMVMSTMHQMDPDRLLRVHSLHLVSCCIDVPSSDVHGPSVAYLHNMMALTRRVIQPSEFPDSLHIVVSICRRLGRMADENVDVQAAAPHAFMASACRLFEDDAWKPLFHEASEIDEDLKYTISQTLPMMAICQRGSESTLPQRAPSIPSDDEENVAPDEGNVTRGGIHRSCLGLTGKLNQCFACGKMESKKGAFKHCGRCQVACYCSRECQVGHWKKHKKECSKSS